MESIKLWKEKHLPGENSTIDVFGDNISSGSILITRGAINKTASHTQNLAVRNVINDIEYSIKKWEYVGWLECRTDKKTVKPNMVLPIINFMLTKLGS